MTIETKKSMVLYDHIEYNGGTKTVCVSTCLNYLGISPDKYNYTSGKKFNSYEGVLRKFGYGLRSRMSELKVKKFRSSMTSVRRALKKSKYGTKDLFLVYVVASVGAHLVIVNGRGEVIIDTAPNSRWHVGYVKQIVRK